MGLSKIKKVSNRKTKKKDADIKNGCQTAKKKRKKKQKKGTIDRRPQRSSSPSCCCSRCCSSPPFVVLLVATTLLGVGAGRYFAGSCCCRSSLLVVVAAGCGCWFAAVLFLFVAAALFKIYYRVGLGRVRPTPTAKKTKKAAIPPFPLFRHDPPWL